MPSPDSATVSAQGPLVATGSPLVHWVQRRWVRLAGSAVITSVLAACGAGSPPEVSSLGSISFGDTEADIDLLHIEDGQVAVQAVTRSPATVAVEISRGDNDEGFIYREDGEQVAYGYNSHAVGLTGRQRGDVSDAQARCDADIRVRLDGSDRDGNVIRADVGIHFANAGDCGSAELISATDLPGVRAGRFDVQASDVLGH